MKHAILAFTAICLFLASASAREAVNVTRDHEPFSRNPDVVYDHVNQRFFVVWQDDEGAILGRWVLDNGDLGPLKRIFEPVRQLNATLTFSDPAVAFQEGGSPSGDDALFVVARMSQSLITAVRTRGVEMVGRRLNADGDPQSAVLGLSDTSPFGPTPAPIADLDGAPDIAAPDTTDYGPPLAVWTQGKVVKARYWPEFVSDPPFRLHDNKMLEAHDSPSVAFQDERTSEPRFVTAFGAFVLGQGAQIAAVATPAGSTGLQTPTVLIQTIHPAFNPGSALPVRQDPGIAFNGETAQIVFARDLGGRWFVEQAPLKPEPLAAGRSEIIPFFYLFARSEQYPAISRYGGGFAAAYDIAAFGGYSAGVMIYDSQGRRVMGVSAKRPNQSRALFEGVENLSIAASGRNQVIGAAWNSAPRVGSRGAEPQIWLYIDTPPVP